MGRERERERRVAVPGRTIVGLCLIIVREEVANVIKRDKVHSNGSSERPTDRQKGIERKRHAEQKEQQYVYCNQIEYQKKRKEKKKKNRKGQMDEQMRELVTSGGGLTFSGPWGCRTV